MSKLISQTLRKFSKKLSQENFLVLTVIFLAYSFFLIRFFTFILNFTPNIIFWDEWELVDLLNKNTDLVSLFFTQHNEHRIGTGLLLFKFLVTFSNWNIIFETFTSGVLIALSSLIALLIKRKLFGKFDYWDVLIPIIFLNLYQWENLVTGFQILFILPLFFFFLSLYLFTLPNSLLRNFSLLIISFLSAYSHFHGLIVSLIISLFFFYNFITLKAQRNSFLAYFVTSFLLPSTYFLNYQREPNFRVKEVNLNFLIGIVKYVFLEITRLTGFLPKKVFSSFFDFFYNFLIIITAPIISIGFFVFSLFMFNKERNLKFMIILFLFIFSLLFATITAYGRIQLGVEGGYTPRYSTFIIPIYLGIFFSLKTLQNRQIQTFLSIVLIGLFLTVHFLGDYQNYTHVQERKKGLSSWSKCYLKTEDIQTCNKETQALVYPGENPPSLKTRLELLKERKLNIFSQ